MKLIPLALSALIALAPALAEARVGAGQSFGSRGSQTYSAPPSTGTSPYGASPMQRSFTPNSQNSYQSGGGFGSYGYRPRSSLGAGLMGGLIGAGIGGMLFGRGFFGGMHGGFGFLGFLLQIFLLYLVARWLFRRFAGGPMFAGAAGRFARNGAQPAPFAPTRGGFGSGRQPIQIGSGDYQAFDRLLHDMQAAWSAQDLNRLGAIATPEMVSYFGEQLAEQTSRGVRNIVSDVRLEKGDLAEAWAEAGREYATVAMRFSMIDVTRDAAGRVVDGSATERVTVTEYWSFLRAPRGLWILSAIQQAR